MHQLMGARWHQKRPLGYLMLSFLCRCHGKWRWEPFLVPTGPPLAVAFAPPPAAETVVSVQWLIFSDAVQ